MVVRRADSPPTRWETVAGDLPPWVEPVLVVLPALSYTAGAFWPETFGRIAFASMLPLIGVGLWMRRRYRGRSDLPPALDRMLAIPVNPLVILLHPVRTLRATGEAVAYALRNRSETRAWYERRSRS